jgi:DNA repair protein RecO
MYAIHTTPGFIIESRPSGEAGKLLSIFTRDLGLVWAIAQGIRLEKSKLRYHTQEYSFSEFSFVRGKEFWRLTSANESKNEERKEDPATLAPARELIGRVALLLRRLLQGEETHSELFVEIESAANFISTNNSLSGHMVPPELLQTLESLIVFRILKLLGYIGNDKGIEAKLVEAPFTVELVEAALAQRKTLNTHINKALKESHL